MYLTAAVQGYALGLSLILAIGAQNAFVLRQGLSGQHVFAVCLTCALSDAILISAGVAGFATIADRIAGIEPILRWGGAAFLLVYGALRFLASWRGGEQLKPSSGSAVSLRTALAVCLTLTWANPHVYLDTLVLIGSVSTRYGGAELAFTAGAVLASFSFFFALGYGAALLRPVFARAGAWRILEIVIGLVMWAIAYSLVAA